MTPLFLFHLSIIVSMMIGLQIGLWRWRWLRRTVGTLLLWAVSALVLIGVGIPAVRVLAADAKISALSALTTPLSTDITVAVSDPGGSPASKKITFATLQASFPPRNFIDGGVCSTASNTTIQITPVVAFIESLGYAIAASPGALTFAAGASSKSHLYLKSDGTLEDSTTAPVAFATAAGTARSKSGDTTRRYLCSFFTDGSSHIYPFTMTESGNGIGVISYTTPSLTAAPYTAVINGHNTSFPGTEVDFSGIVPPNVVRRMRLGLIVVGDATHLVPELQLSRDGITLHSDWNEDVNATSAQFIAMDWMVMEPTTPGIYYTVNNAAYGFYGSTQGYEFAR